MRPDVIWKGASEAHFLSGAVSSRTVPDFHFARD